MKRGILIAAGVLVVAVVALVASLRIMSAKRHGPVDSWVEPSNRKGPPQAPFTVAVVAWLDPAHRPDAIAALESVTALAVDEADLRRFLLNVEAPAGEPGCTHYLVRGVVHRGYESGMTRVFVDGATIDAQIYGGSGCRLDALERAPFVACLQERPERVLTSWKCEPQDAWMKLLFGPGDRP